MNTDEYKRILLAKEQDLVIQIKNAHQDAEELSPDDVNDVGDASVSDEQKDQQFSGIERAQSLLKQVQDALQRIEDGTFGKCVVDSGPIQEQRLKAVPWTPYCLKHSRLLDRGSLANTATL
jgi:DnaK suppressor protein